MPTISLDITVTAAEAARLQAAFQAAANASVGGTATQAQDLAYLKSQIRQQIINRVKLHEIDVAVAAAQPTLISPT